MRKKPGKRERLAGKERDKRRGVYTFQGAPHGEWYKIGSNKKRYPR